MKNMRFINNGVEIPNTEKCVWCGGEMKRGTAYMGAGTNSFTLLCTCCGAVSHHARNFEKKISGLIVQYEFDETKK